MNHHKVQKKIQHDILLVDDAFDNLQLLMDILTSYGYYVRPASSGYLALRSVKVKPPDLILLDIKMPDMNGFEVCRRLKLDEETRAIPVIFVSIYSNIAKKFEAFQAGGVGYITKPLDIDKLLTIVRTNLM